MKRTNETGRSMVEMLGVLAIIGVLSVGGIAGYTMAMNRYRANEVIDMANKYTVVAFAARETNRTMNNGTVSGTFSVPAFCDTGLVATTGSGAAANCKVNGTAIGNASFFKDATCGTAANDSDTAMGAQVTLTFDDEAVCKAAASTLGQTCTDGTTVTFCSRNS